LAVMGGSFVSNIVKRSYSTIKVFGAVRPGL